MNKKRANRFEVELNYNYVSKEALRRGFALFIAASAILAGALYTIHRQQTNPNARARREISAASTQVSRLRVLPRATRLATEIDQVAAKLREAEGALLDGRPEDAQRAAEESQAMARKVLEEEANVRGDAHIAEAEGRVELQRAGLATWEPARPGMQLYEGDFLKTGPNGAADIVFAEGSRYKIKPDTLFEVHRTSTVTGAGGESNRRSEIKFIAGRVEIDTGEAGRSVVITDSATANIESGSSVGVDLDERKSVGVSTFEGSARLATVKGGVVTIRERERATASADGGIGGKQLLPEPPRALTPEDNTIFDVRAKAPIALAWSAIKDARRYHLQIARSRLFIPDSVMVDLPDRAKTTTLVRVEREGTYFWRVAAISGAALSSEWSSPRRFKVQPAEARRGTPPALEVQKPQVNGRIVIVTGRTEPGCSVTINGEPADPDTGGGFTKVLSMTAEGVNVIEVRAVDGAGNEAVRRESVAIRVY